MDKVEFKKQLDMFFDDPESSRLVRHAAWMRYQARRDYYKVVICYFDDGYSRAVALRHATSVAVWADNLANLDPGQLAELSPPKLVLVEHLIAAKAAGGRFQWKDLKNFTDVKQKVAHQAAAVINSLVVS